jgi:hypothetical protein
MKINLDYESGKSYSMNLTPEETILIEPPRDEPEAAACYVLRYSGKDKPRKYRPVQIIFDDPEDADRWIFAFMKARALLKKEER